VGDPLQAGTQLGPLARSDLREALTAQIQASVHQGARVLTGGGSIAGAGWFHQPTVLAEVTRPLPVVAQGTFGPAAAVAAARARAHWHARTVQPADGVGGLTFVLPEGSGPHKPPATATLAPVT